MDYTRNSDLTYYESHPDDANCGSYALSLNEWYDPEEYFEDINGDIRGWIEEMYEEGYSDCEITDIYSSILVEGMLQEFEGELEPCCGAPARNSNEELIAFCTFCHWEPDYDSDYDFHFKVFRNGSWLEKNGSERVKFCEEDEWGRYTGDVYYFYHKIGE